MITCTTCSRKYTYTRTAGHTFKECNSCLVNKRRFSLRKKIITLMDGKCSECGYSRCYGALDAHHVDKSTKSFTISGAHARSWEAIEQELKKCILLCSNCHHEHHHNCEDYGCPQL